MDEQVFSCLAEWLGAGHYVVLASVLDTQGATPRERRSRMLIATERLAFSVGGGAMEGRVIDAARHMLAHGENHRQMHIELTGRADAAGVCGGTMRLALRRWQASEHAAALTLAESLQQGRCVQLTGEFLGDLETTHTLYPVPRLLIIGGGHCGHALAEIASHLAFDVWVADARSTCFTDQRYPVGTHCISADPKALQPAANTARDTYLVLLNRDYPTDVASLEALAGTPNVFLGMMVAAAALLTS